MYTWQHPERLQTTNLDSFLLNKPSSYKIVSEPETSQNKNLNKSVLNTKTSYLEDENNEEVYLKGETLTFTLQMIKILTNK